jgi:DNA-binding NarL/FixJ family response regulator
LAEAIRQVYAGQTALSPRVSTKIVNRMNTRQVYRTNTMLEGLSEREMEVLRAAAHGDSNKVIAAKLGISAQTVQVHLRNIFGKLLVGSRSEAVARAIQNGWITLENDDE